MKPTRTAQKAAFSEVDRATYTAWLLLILPDEIFPLGPESTPEADQHLIDCIISKLYHLTKRAAQSKDRSPRALWFRKTLDHCNAVMNGTCEPAENNGSGFENTGGFRRGIYLFQEATRDGRTD